MFLFLGPSTRLALLLFGDLKGVGTGQGSSDRNLAGLAGLADWCLLSDANEGTMSFGLLSPVCTVDFAVLTCECLERIEVRQRFAVWV
jgi:hypothetical protein